MTRLICILVVALIASWGLWHVLSTGIAAFALWDISVMYDVAGWEPAGRAFYGVLGLAWVFFVFEPVGEFVVYVWEELP